MSAGDHDHPHPPGHAEYPEHPKELDDDACCAPGADEVTRAAEARRDKVRRVFWITLGLNSLVAVSKALYSYVSGSLTLGADSLHAVLDASSNVLALFSLGWAAAP